ncbi:unnamed protein product [Parnassius mnemosyne]|uniref:Uncharacterized protein n=1 Tax=Parnassius mnemosyne TaxID=213953 RepID=A0AAV1LJM9_9NEOP
MKFRSGSANTRLSLVIVSLSRNYYKRCNGTDQKKIEVLLHEAISNVSQKNWEDCVKHAEKLQEEDLKKSHLAEDIVIHVDDYDSDDSDVEF